MGSRPLSRAILSRGCDEGEDILTASGPSESSTAPRLSVASGTDTRIPGNIADQSCVAKLVSRRNETMSLFSSTIVTAILLLYPTWRISSRAGFPGPLSLVVLIPGLGIFILLIILAFVRWPITRDVAATPYELR